MLRIALTGIILVALAHTAHADEQGKKPPPEVPRAEPGPGRAPDELSCKASRDCVHLPSVCPGCAPCKPTPRPVSNRRALKRIQQMQRVVDCAQPRCRPCANQANWRGKPTCVKGRCAAVEPRTEGCYEGCLRDNQMRAESFEGIKAHCRHRCKVDGPPVLPWSKERACKADRDCVLKPQAPCTCSPCGALWRAAFNREALRAWRSKWARARCAQLACPACATHYLGSKAVCAKGQCVVVR